MQGKQYEVTEFCFKGAEPPGSQVEVDATGCFTLGECRITVPGFYAGNGEYKLRFLPELTGDWQYEIGSEFLCLKESGTLSVIPADPGRHGPVRPKGTAMYYADGTWCPTFGTTVYALASQSEALIEETLESLSNAPFNKLRTCVFPKHYVYNTNNPQYYAFEKKPGREEKRFSAEGLPPFPQKEAERDDYWDTTRPSFAFWDHFEGILKRLDEMGIQVDLILFHPYDRWGFSNLSLEDSLRYLDYLLRRLSAFPNLWWSLANEYDLCFNKTEKDFRDYETFIAKRDPFRHPVSNHNCFKIWDAGSENITHVSWQTKELTRVAEKLQKHGKPVLIDECRYEGNVPEFWGNLSGEDMTRSFWRVTSQGGYCTHGETFLPETEKGKKATRTGEPDVVWWARGGRLNGESPARIAFLRKIVENLPGPLEPFDSGLGGLAMLDDDALRKAITTAPSGFGDVLNAISRMGYADRKGMFTMEYSYQGHCGDDAYLWYLDDQCAAVYSISLPENRKYRVDVMDTWNMTCETVFSGASGEVRVPLPGRRYMAILATAESQ